MPAAPFRPALMPRSRFFGPTPLVQVDTSPSPSSTALAQAASLASTAVPRSVASVAALASAWSEVHRRLPASFGDGPDPDLRFEQIIAALKLALAALQLAPPRADGRSPSGRAVQLAATLADLCAAGLPLDSDSIAAGILADAVQLGCLDHRVVTDRLGPSVGLLVHDILQVQEAALRIEVYDDEAAR